MARYEQATGRWINTIGDVIGIGYAGGDCGMRADGVNNPALEGVRYVGPLPAGHYLADYLIQHHARLGAFAVHLSPDPETRAKIIAYGRDPDSFFVHGDSIALAGEKSASDGCIVISRDVRESGFWMTLDHDLEVIPGYPRVAADLDSEIAG